jgi:pyruvate/2-oxoglutarate dehydrogenase complex dihydrolipoamide acyltransferase (E2) component
VAHPARSAASPVSVPAAPVPVSGTASSVRSRRTRRVDPGWADALAERRRAIRAVVGRRMAKSAAVPQFTVFADIDLEALDRVREGLGVYFLQALVTPSEVCVSSLEAVARQPAAHNRGLTVRLRCGVGLTVDHRVAEGRTRLAPSRT